MSGRVDKIEHDIGQVEYLFDCPGCGVSHSFVTEYGPKQNKTHPVWSFNGDLERPTFSPSLLVKWQFRDGIPEKRCHSFVRDGKIQFLDDCTHGLAGKTVPLAERDRDED